MSRDLIHSIAQQMPGFSKGQKLIAQYILEHYDKAAFMTAAKLGMTVGVSESTVVRFASELGFEGYPQLQRALQELIRNRLTSVQRMEVTSDQLGEGNILHKVLNMDIERIRRTMEKASIEDFEQAVNTIINAKNIYILGVRSASALSGFMSFYFNQIFGYQQFNLLELREYEFWLAQYSDVPDFYYNFQMWQYTNQGSIPGIEGMVDMNISFVDYAGDT